MTVIFKIDIYSLCVCIYLLLYVSSHIELGLVFWNWFSQKLKEDLTFFSVGCVGMTYEGRGREERDEKLLNKPVS